MRFSLLLLLVPLLLAAQGNFADEETPSGVVDGVNGRFFLAHIPNPLSSVAAYKNGVRQKKGLDSDLTAFVSGGRAVVLFNPCCIPHPGDILMVDYRY